MSGHSEYSRKVMSETLLRAAASRRLAGDFPKDIARDFGVSKGFLLKSLRAWSGWKPTERATDNV